MPKALLVHRLDPRGKIVVAALFAILVAVAKTLPAILAGLALALGWLALARLPGKQVLAKLLAVNSFIFFLWLVLPFSYPGDQVWQLGPLAATRQGIAVTALITLKSNAIIIGLIALIATVPVVTLGQAMHNLRLPNKLCHLLLFTYRYLYVFELEFQRLVQAMKIRGFEPRTNLIPIAATPIWPPCCWCGALTGLTAFFKPCCAGAFMASFTV